MTAYSDTAKEFQSPKVIECLLQQIHQSTTRPWKIMEICGGQTHAFAKHGLLPLLPKKIELIHGPGCPVCVTPIQVINHALSLSTQKNTLLCTFGDMLNVPGSEYSLAQSKAHGGKVKMVYSPLEAVNHAKQNPDLNVVLFAVGFETTAPIHAASLIQAIRLNLHNFSLLTSLVRVPPALSALLSSPSNEVQGILAAGHVCTIMGSSEYHQLADDFGVPIVITGFEPADLLQGLLRCIQQLEAKQPGLYNEYERMAQPHGNLAAKQILNDAFEVVDTHWRGFGIIAQGGYQIRSQYASFDALKRYPLKEKPSESHHICIADKILRGTKKPCDCPAFAKQCTPLSPLGAPMVSSEGACSAYYRYLR